MFFNEPLANSVPSSPNFDVPEVLKLVNDITREINDFIEKQQKLPSHFNINGGKIIQKKSNKRKFEGNEYEIPPLVLESLKQVKTDMQKIIEKKAYEYNNMKDWKSCIMQAIKDGFDSIPSNLETIEIKKLETELKNLIGLLQPENGFKKLSF